MNQFNSFVAQQLFTPSLGSGGQPAIGSPTTVGWYNPNVPLCSYSPTSQLPSPTSSLSITSNNRRIPNRRPAASALASIDVDDIEDNESVDKEEDVNPDAAESAAVNQLVHITTHLRKRNGTQAAYFPRIEQFKVIVKSSRTTRGSVKTFHRSGAAKTSIPTTELPNESYCVILLI